MVKSNYKLILSFILKYITIFGLFFLIANIFINFQLKKIEKKIDEVSYELGEQISLQKLEKEIIRSAKNGGIDEETQTEIANSLSTIYKRDILPIIIKMSLNNSE